MIESVETYEKNGLNISIYQDNDSESPREWDNLGTMVCFHKRYNLGDKHDYKQKDFNYWSLLEKRIMEDHHPIVCLPIYLFDHSGLSLNYDSSRFEACDSDRWDWGQVGFIFTTQEKIKERFADVEREKSQIEDILKAEILTYSQFLSGEVYGYIVTDQDGEEVDSCWGFYGMESVKEMADEAAQRDTN